MIVDNLRFNSEVEPRVVRESSADFGCFWARSQIALARITRSLLSLR